MQLLNDDTVGSYYHYTFCAKYDYLTLNFICTIIMLKLKDEMR